MPPCCSISGRRSPKRFTGEGYREFWARLRFAAIRTSPGRVRRLMRENGLLAPHRVRKRPDRMHDGSITTAAVDVMWGTDMSQTVTLAEGVAHVFVAVDHCNSECVGIHTNRFLICRREIFRNPSWRAALSYSKIARIACGRVFQS